jgi:photosystem II stability/assembly factor-like uncharacterized protein
MKLIAALVWALTISASAQFEILDGKSTASLRGIDAVSPQVAWASGSGGTVLLTTDGGANWKHCAVPPGGEKLDFRGVRARDEKTALVMASGTGKASAIYKTTDGCAGWKLVLANPDANGFFDALLRVNGPNFYVMGDQVGGRFTVFSSRDGGETWSRDISPGLEADKGAGGFAASNSGLIALIQTREGSTFEFATSATDAEPPMAYRYWKASWHKAAIPMPANGSTSGVFSLASDGSSVVAVGGNYSKPNEMAGTAAYSADLGEHWQSSKTMPSGYRSAVAFVASFEAWIAVGPNGTDISKDDGKNWTPLKPSASDAPDADKNWNAISLPFVVGSKGKIGKLTAKF